MSMKTVTISSAVITADKTGHNTIAYSPSGSYIGYIDIGSILDTRIKKKNCENCGAPVNWGRHDCEYCGTRY